MVLSKVAMLPDKVAKSRLATIKLKAGQGKGQVYGAVADSPTTPSSPRIAALSSIFQVRTGQTSRFAQHDINLVSISVLQVHTPISI